MTASPETARVKAEVRSYYDSVGWAEIGDGLYQNARYEDLRPVSQEYIRRCHRRVGRHLPSSGRLLLDAGSGPIQYPDYLEYSQGFERRVCLDISRRALVEARRRLGDRGRVVAGDLAALPFPAGAFDGVVSLHALHHVPSEEQETALTEMRRVGAAQAPVVVVYSWGGASRLMRLFRPLIAVVSPALRAYAGRTSRRLTPAPAALGAPGSHTFKHDHKWMQAVLHRLGGGRVLVWRSLSTEFLRTLIHRPLGGRLLLRLAYRLEEAWPNWFGRHGMYPLIVLPGAGTGHGGKPA